MTEQEIKELALANGFKLKEQPDGQMDLNPYVYDFARALLQAAQQKEGYVLVPVDQAKDTQRIDWLADKNQNIGNVMLPTVCVEQNLHSLRGAIDMAMQLEQVND